MKEKIVNALIELLKPRTLFSALFYITFCYFVFQRVKNPQLEMPEELITVISVTLGYYFGSKQQQKGGKSNVDND